MLISIIIRTLNEERYLDDLLQGIANQDLPPGWQSEVVLVDSGSTDQSIPIARRHGCLIEQISPERFTFGYSLNVGCERANGDHLVFISGHCIPQDNRWLKELVAPLADQRYDYCYGRQLGWSSSRFSETQFLAEEFPAKDAAPDAPVFANNANAAMRRSVWQELRFDEKLPGLEDLAIALQIADNGGKVGYVPTAPVFHIHHESWKQIRHRYFREAVALTTIQPTQRDTLGAMLKGLMVNIGRDYKQAVAERRWFTLPEIILWRTANVLGTWQGLSAEPSVTANEAITERHSSSPIPPDAKRPRQQPTPVRSSQRTT